MEQDDDTSTDTPATPRRPGRPRGLGKVPGSGRKSGSRNVASKEAKAEARQTLDRHGSRIINKLVNIALGKKQRVGKEWRAPSEQSTMKALEILSRKLMPDLASQELKADVATRTANDVSDHELAVWIADVMERATFDADEEASGGVIEHNPTPRQLPHRPVHLDHTLDVAANTKPAPEAPPKQPDPNARLNARIDERISDMRTRPQVVTGYGAARRR